MNDTSTNTEMFLRSATRPSPKLSPPRTALSLTHVVEAAVRNIDDRAINPLPRHQRSSGEDAKRLLAVLAWSYSREIYSSQQIQSWISGGNADNLWENGAPDQAELDRFRSENRSALQVCLLAALRFQAAQKMAEGVVTRVNETHLAAEATRRIVAAMFLDAADTASAGPAGDWARAAN